MKQAPLLVLLILSLANKNGLAQIYSGIGFGVTSGFTNNADVDRNRYKIKPKIGIQYSSFGRVRFSKATSFLTTVSLIQKNYTIERVDDLKGVYFDFINTYLQVPLSMNIGVISKEKFTLSIELGVFGSYWLTSRRKGRMPNVFGVSSGLEEGDNAMQRVELSKFNEMYRFEASRDKRWGAGLVFGSGLVVPKKTISYFANLKFSKSVTSQQPSSSLWNGGQTVGALLLETGFFAKLIK